MRKFITIVETITNDLALNQEIETKLQVLPDADRTLVLDGMEAIMNAGTITIQQWFQAMKQMWPEFVLDEGRRIFKLILGDFPGLIERVGPGEYRWVGQRHTDGDIDLSSPLAQMAKSQIEYSGFIMQIMKGAGTFTPEEVTTRFSAGTGLPHDMAGMLVQHVIDQSAATVKANGDGSYRWEEAPRKTGLGFLRDLEGYQDRPTEV